MNSNFLTSAIIARKRFGLSRVFSIMVLSLCIAWQADAQFPGGGFNPFGGGGGGANANRSRTSTRNYPNNGVGDAVISIDPETRSLVVIADEDTSKYISQVVSNLDRPKPQVLIKVVFLEVTHNDSSDIGIDGSYNKSFGSSLVSGFTTNFGVISNAIVPTSITPITSGATAFTGSNVFGLSPLGIGSTAGLYQIFGNDYQVTLRAIAQAGRAKVLSRPSIVARNNQPATITVGQSVPLITSVRFDNFGNAINSVSYQSVGIILRVTPFITSDGLVEMILSPETSELVADRSQWVPISSGASGNVSAPVINSRSADTVIVTPDGQTVIIGGLMANSKADTETKIPLLGDIPILGNLFKHKTKTDSKTELMIFLTPHIIQAPVEIAAVSNRERANSDASKGLTERELNKFLDEFPTVTNGVPPKASAKKKKSNADDY
jgi:general secretion pathway protein D